MHTLFRSSNLLRHFACRLSQPQCIRSLSSTAVAQSGHSRWSKIKHDKAKVDAGTSKLRSYLSQQIATSVKDNGPDPKQNLRLAALLAEAKKAGFPKASIEAAIARGQGKSLSGAPLDSMMLEFMLPPAVAGILEVETDSKTRTTQQLKHVMREHGASLTPCAYMFDRRGRITFEAKGGETEDEVLEHAIEAGALDVDSDQEEQSVMIWTEPEEMAAVCGQLTSALGRHAIAQQLVYVAKEDTRTEDAGPELDSLLEKLQDFSEVQEIYVNIT